MMMTVKLMIAVPATKYKVVIITIIIMIIAPPTKSLLMCGDPRAVDYNGPHTAIIAPSQEL